MYEKDLKRRILRERENRFELKQDIDKEKTEQGVREYLARSVVVVATQSKDKGKGVVKSQLAPPFSEWKIRWKKGLKCI